MKRFILIALMPLFLLQMACGASFHDGRGKKLDWPRKGNPTVEITWYNASESKTPFFAGRKTIDPDLYLVMPGDSLTLVFKTDRRIEYLIIWDCQDCLEDNVGGVEKEVKFSFTGLVTGTPIYVNDAFLRNMSMAWGDVTNSSPEAVRVWDSQHNQYGVLQPGETSISVSLWPMETTFYWLPVKTRSWQKRASSKTGTPNQANDSPTKDGLTGWTLVIEEAVNRKQQY